MLPMQCVEYLSKAKESKMILQKTNVPDERTEGREGMERMSLQFLFRRMEDGRRMGRTDGRTAVEE